MGPDRLGDPGPTGDAPDDAGGSVAVETSAAGAGEDRPLGSFADARSMALAVRGAGGVLTILPPLRRIVRIRRPRSRPTASGHRAQTMGDRGSGPTSLLWGPGPGFDIGSAFREQRQASVRTPGDVLAQVQGVGVTSRAPVAGQECCQGQPFALREHRLADDHRRGWSVWHGLPPESAGHEGPEATVESTDARSTPRPPPGPPERARTCPDPFRPGLLTGHRRARRCRSGAAREKLRRLSFGMAVGVAAAARRCLSPDGQSDAGDCNIVCGAGPDGRAPLYLPSRAL
jgi:hypothetical protein